MRVSSGPFWAFFLSLACLYLSACRDDSILSRTQRGPEALIERARLLGEEGNPAKARELLLPLAAVSQPDLRVLRLLSRLARDEGDHHEALLWLDMADSAALELSLLCMDRSRLLWQLRGGRDALVDIELSLSLLERLPEGEGRRKDRLGALRSVALALRSGISGALGD